MELIKETKQVHLSTTSGAGRIINQDTNFKSQIEFNIPNLIRKEDDIEYIMFSVPYAVIPVSFYTINETNNKLVYNITNPTANNATITFPSGNYNANQFITAFLANKNASHNLTISLDPVTSKFSVFNTTGEIRLLAASTCDFIMGFSGDVVGTTSGGGQVARCPRVCNFLALPRINMRCNLLANSTMAGSQQTNDLVITIPNNSKPNGQIVYNNSSGIQMLFQQEILNSFVVSLTNDFGELINFNGVSSFWVFQFDIYRKKIDKPQSFYNVLANVNKETLKKDLEQEQK
jgi:hypothetical protein